MEDPVSEIPTIIHRLTQGSPSVQRATLEEYFTPDASFTHPFCRTTRSPYSRLLILAIYRWYKILSPNIELKVNGVAFDHRNLVLYVNAHQTFSLALFPFHHAHVALTTVLHLTTDNPQVTSDPPSLSFKDPQPTKVSQIQLYGQPTKYRIISQEDLYQPSDFVKFLPTYGIGYVLILLWQYMNTMLCVLGAIVGSPFTAYLDRRDRNKKLTASSRKGSRGQE